MGQDAYYNAFYRELSRIDNQHNSITKIEALLPSLKNATRVLDIGCGHGAIAKTLLDRGCDVSGMEINAEALDSLRQAGVRAIEQDISVPFELPARYELILLLDVLEHVFDPVSLLEVAHKHLDENGQLIITVPLYFDLFDRLRVLFTGSIISYDNNAYGREIMSRFRSFNYDHIRFFRPNDVFEMASLAGLDVETVDYKPMHGWSSISGLFAKVLANRFTVSRWPGLFAHSMGVRLRARKTSS
jgi:SAM-dependent methyltransferase